MSDPVSNSDIEDVLSSIRRLVSEEPVARKPIGKDAEMATDRLVLTPAFRVPDDDTSNASEADLVDSGDVPAEEAEPTADHDEALAQAGPQDAQDDETPASTDAEGAQGHDAAEDTANSEHPTMDDGEPVADMAEDVAEDLGSSEPIVLHPQQNDEHETAHEIAGGDPGDTSLSSEAASAAAAALAAFEATDDWSDAPLKEGSDQLDANAQPEPNPVDMSLQQRIAELEAAIEQSPHEWEPDGSEEGTDDETRPLSDDLAEAVAPAEPDALKAEEAGTLSTDEQAVQVQDPPDDGLEATLPEPVEDALAKQSLAEDAAVPQEALVRLSELDHQGPEHVAPAPDDETAFEPQELPSASEGLDAKAEEDAAQEHAAELVDDTSAEQASAKDSVAPSDVPDQPSETALPDSANAPELEENPSDAEVLQHQAPPPVSELGSVEPQPLSPDSVAELWEDIEAEPTDDNAASDAEPDAASDVEPDTGFDAQADEAQDPTEAEDGLFDDLATIDEDALRMMIADLIQQELQGVLGERITRNVRRLVRREIQRALAVRDLE